jgi:prepilin-type processing-associated H-X9-DG protein
MPNQEIKMRSACSRSLWIVSALIVLASATALSAQTTLPAAVERAMKYAPAKSAAVIHVEPKALAKDLLTGFAKDPEFKALDANAIAVLIKLMEKIDSLDVFIPEAESESGLPLFVIRGGLTPADVNQLAGLFLGDDEDLLEKKEDANGRYEICLGGDKPILELVHGSKAPELPAGLSLLGPPKVLATESLAKLGTGLGPELRKLLPGVDSAAPIWFAIRGDKLSKETDIPKTAVGGIYLLGGGQSKAVLEFQDGNAAEEAIREVVKAKDEEGVLARMFLAVMDSARQGAVVTYTSKTKDSMVPAIVSVMAEERKAGKKASSAAFLKEIGDTVTVWSADHDDKLPQSLLDLVKDGAIPAQMLVSPAGERRKVKTDGKGMPEGAFEPDYILVKYAMTVPKIKESAKKVLAYERPEIYKSEGTHVLYVDGHVDWVKMDEFKAQLKATQEWIAGQEKK